MSKRFIVFLLAFVLNAILLSSCGNTADLANGQKTKLVITKSPNISPSETRTPTTSPTIQPSKTTQPSETVPPSFTPLPTESSTPTLTPVPWSSEEITSENADEIVQLAIWGRGSLMRKEIVSGGRYLVVQTPLGVYLYELSDLKVAAFFENALGFLISPNGKYLALSYPDSGSIELWQVENPQLLHLLDYSPDVTKFPAWEYFLLPSLVTAMTFSSDSSTLAAGYIDSHINLWDTSSGNISQELHHPIVHAPLKIVFSSDGTKLATDNWGKVIAVWSLVGNELLWRTANGGKLSIKSFAPDSKTLITVGLSTSKILFWDLTDGKLLKSYGAANLQQLVGYSQDGNELIVYGVREQSGIEFLELRSMDDGELHETLEIPIENAILDQNFNSLFVYSERGLSRFIPNQWDWGTINVEPNLAGEILTSQIGDEVAIINESDAKIWKVSTGDELSYVFFGEKFIASHLSGIDGVSWLPDKGIAAWGWNGTDVYWWNVISDYLERVEIDDWPINISAFSTETSVFAVCTKSALEIVSIYDGSRQTLDRCRQSGFLEFSPDGEFLARSNVLVLDLLYKSNWTVAHSMHGHTLPVEVVSYSPSGRYIASGSSVDRGGAEVAIWRTDPPSQLMQFIVPSYGIGSLAFSWDDSLLATGGGGSKVRLWRVSDGWMLDSLDIEGSALTLSFSPNGKILAAGTYLGDIYLFDVASSEVLFRFKAHKRGVIDIEFSLDGTELITAGHDGTVRLWGIP